MVLTNSDEQIEAEINKFNISQDPESSRSEIYDVDNLKSEDSIEEIEDVDEVIEDMTKENNFETILTEKTTVIEENNVEGKFTFYILNNHK